MYQRGLMGVGLSLAAHHTSGPCNLAADRCAYDPLKEFSTIGFVAIASVVFAAHPSFLRTLPGMIGWCAPTPPDRS